MFRVPQAAGERELSVFAEAINGDGREIEHDPEKWKPVFG
jgi:hypothetical protein